MNQRRRHSPAVYRRRRLVAALLAVVVLALAAWGARSLLDYFSADEDTTAEAGAAQQEADDDGSGSEDPADSEPAETDDDAAGPDSEDSAADETAEDPGVPEDACAPADIEVRASTHEDSYAADVAPLLIMEIENTADEECTFDVGTAEQVFTVSHGGREIFNTAQCQASSESLEIEFEPGQTERAELTWPRSDSGVDCTEPAELTTGDYELAVSVSGISSEPHSFHITGIEQ